MPLWKSLFVRSAALGAGFAIVLCLVAASWLWYSGRPKPPKPWNKQAIIAEYDFVEPAGDKDYLVFHYVLQNNSDFDYRIESNAGAEITGRLKKEKGYSQFANHYVTTDYPIFLPAKSRVWIPLTIPYPYSAKLKEKASREERKQYIAGVEKYLCEELPNLDGFVLFDASHRYEIDFPNGWEPQAKKAVATK